MAQITLQPVGARIYIAGNTYPLKDAIKSCGGHWDGDRKQWWVGQAKQADIARVVEQSDSQGPAASQDRRSDTPDQAARVKARATYKGKDYYVLAETRDGAKLLLAARNGQFQFWATAEATQITKQYGRENYRTGYDEYPTLGGMMARAEQWRRMSDDDRAVASSPRTGCSCGSRDGVVQDTDCASCRFDELDN